MLLNLPHKPNTQPVAGDQVGLVPALLGPDLTPAAHNRYCGLAGGNADDQLLRRSSGRSDDVQRRSARAGEHTGSLRWWDSSVARNPGAECVQAAGHDSIRVA